MESKPLLLLISILTLLMAFGLPLTHASKRSVKRGTKKLKMEMDFEAHASPGVRWKGPKLLALKSGIIKWHVHDNCEVKKFDRLLTIQWNEETSNGEDFEAEETVVAPWPGRVRIRNLRKCNFSEATKTILSIE